MRLAKRSPLRASAVIALLAAVSVPAPAIASRESALLRSRAADELYDLDRERAIETFKEAIAARSLCRVCVTGGCDFSDAGHRQSPV